VCYEPNSLFHGGGQDQNDLINHVNTRPKGVGYEKKVGGRVR
jgi:hypothetical protein